MPYIQQLKRTNENEHFSFKVEFHLGTNPEGKPITQTSILKAPEELSEAEALQCVQQTAEAWEKVLKSII